MKSSNIALKVIFASECCGLSAHIEYVQSKVQHQTVNYLFSIFFPEKEESGPVR